MYQTISDLRQSDIISAQGECSILKVSTNDMFPFLLRGDIIKLRTVFVADFIQWGRVHMVSVKGYGGLLRKVMPGKTDDFINLVSGNENELPNMEISINEVYEMKIVVASIRNY